MKSAKILKYPSFLIAKIFLFGIILFMPHLVSAQVDRTFWFVAPYVYDAGRDFDKPIVLRITTLSSPATVVISMPADPSFTPITTNIGANSTVSVDLTTWINKLENIPANTTLNKGLLIKSTADITAYYEVVSSFCNCDPEVFSLKGKNALGTEFFISSQYTYDESSAYSGASTSFDIVATQNNTHVTITPTKDIIGHKANVPFTITLNAGQTYSAVAVSGTAAGHLQGSYISSDNAIAVTLKDDLVQVSSCADLIGDQTVPTSVLGTEYIVTKGFLQLNDNIYVLAVADGTSVYVDGNATPTAILAKGESITLNLSNPSTYIRSDKNIYVYHLTGNGCEVGSAIIPKINCTGSQSVSIVRSNSDLFAVMITTKDGNQNNFTVNGDKTLITSSDFSPVPGTGGAYVTSRVDLSSAVTVGAALNFSNSTGKFSLGFINGGTNDGTVYGFFSDFKSSNVQSSSVEICQSASAQLSAFGGVKYQWSPAAGLSDPNIANPKASPAATTDYTVIITTTDGCVDSAKVHVKVYNVKKVDTTVSICAGSSYKLPSGTSVSTAGVYNDVVPYKSGCDSLVTTLHLKVSGTTPSVTIAASGNNICAGTSVTFTATPVNEGPSPVYQWKLNGANTGTNSVTFSNSTLVNGDKVSCVMTSSAACGTPTGVTSNSITMSINPNLAASVNIAAPVNNICAGTMVMFTATPANGGATPVYQWLVNGVNAGTNSATFSSSNFANGDNVSCIMTSNAGCATPAGATSNIVIMSVNPYVAPSVSIAASNNNICPGTQVIFTATPVNGGVAPAYQWLLNGNNTGTNSDTFTSSTFANGDIVSCVITSNAACITTATATSNSISVNVNLPVAPLVTITASANNICAGIPVTFTATPTNGGATPIYQWLLNDNNTGTNSDTFTSDALADGDIVSCRLTSNANCAVPVTVISNGITMNIHPLPVVNIGGDKTIEQGNSVRLNATALGNIADITWSPATGLDNIKTLTPTATPLSTTLYTLTVQSTDGCVGVALVKVTVLEDITIPNTFTPNDDGVNDKWEIKNLKDYPNCTVKIFNRWGQEVYSSRGYYNAWDGTRKGKRLPIGTYYYVINLNNNTRPLGGFVALLR
ncbi:gliding motility-associated C-terminal domain-containing protein [Mucilaginibacter sp. OK098]|uniref:gliding motility-associated C-terminal domain-containing protein n=1 Tax=Mucilaginibacter sp. OK098 TaxID=1855297 RepID=UPI000911F6A5|nr:gliding motility-associated C-terminal domain-containing protein [Mucilaginibacter sp. OK098]SHM54343.1 gliding motility-associated C-terminal domain-containing protein [Mucilaginibacter sp. OK098]